MAATADSMARTRFLESRRQRMTAAAASTSTPKAPPTIIGQMGTPPLLSTRTRAARRRAVELVSFASGCNGGGDEGAGKTSCVAPVRRPGAHV